MTGYTLATLGSGMSKEVLGAAFDVLQKQNIKPCVVTLPGKLIPDNFYCCFLPVEKFSWYPKRANRYAKRYFPA